MSIFKRTMIMGIFGFIAAAGMSPAFADSNLTILDWAGYDTPHLYQDYMKKYNKKPNYSYFANEHEAFNKVRTGFTPDLAHPCDATLSLWRKADLIQPIDVSRISDWNNLFPKLRQLVTHDGKVWMLPFDWGYDSLIYRTDKVKKADVGLNIFVDPAYKDRISLPDATTDAYALAFLATGTDSWDNVTDEQFKRATKWLRRADKNVRFYWTSFGKLARAMASGEIVATWAWNQTWSSLKADGKPVALALNAGVSTWVCGYVYPKKSKAKSQKVYDYLNALMAPESGKYLIDEWGYAHSNRKSFKAANPKSIKADGLDHIDTLLKDSLFQSSPSPELRKKMTQTFQRIKSGF